MIIEFRKLCLLICTKIASSLLPKNDNKVIIAEAIFNSLLRYGAAVFLKPIYDKEDLNMEKNPKNTATLQTLQNNMLRVIFGFKLQNRVNPVKHGTGHFLP